MLRHFLIYAAYVIVLAMLIVALPFIFRSPKLAAPSPSKPKTTISTSAKKTSVASTARPSTHTKTANTPAGSSTTLTNTGPGSSLAVFAISALTGTVIFSYFRRQPSSSKT